ncbi:MAG: prepilin-type N-terminal cleavage/methylation domain-containing protein, partial [Candidatus Omnitrophica bacterium]|nr:prepilin-type N-terminal cleavage/methylation domain-containing protein [Candidatus Omnitrophota bacterium]
MKAKSKAPSRKRQGGFTLTELMIALLVASLVLAGYIGANIQAQRNNDDLHERTIALQDANRVIEPMRND